MRLLVFGMLVNATNRTLKRALTDPRIVSGMGNAYSDEIRHGAQLSPIARTHKLKPEEWERLFQQPEQRSSSEFGAFVRKLARVSLRRSLLFGKAWLCIAERQSVSGLRRKDSARPSSSSQVTFCSRVRLSRPRVSALTDSLDGRFRAALSK